MLKLKQLGALAFDSLIRLRLFVVFNAPIRIIEY